MWRGVVQPGAGSLHPPPLLPCSYPPPLGQYPINYTYPEQQTGTNEPTVWLGTADQVNGDGTLTSVGVYPTSWASTLRAQWGMTALPTSVYPAGAAAIFPHDCFGCVCVCVCVCVLGPMGLRTTV